jgi:hypothetical protein
VGWKWTILFGVIIIILAQSCYKDKFEPIPESINLSPTLAIPIATSELSIDGSLILYGLPEINLDELVPEWAQYDTLYFIDTLAFSLNSIENQVDVIRFIEFNLLTWNNFPVTAQVQLHFINAQGDVLQSLFNPLPLVIAAGIVNSSGETIESGYSFTTIEISEDRINSLTTATQIVIYSSISNLEVPIEQFNFYPSYKLRVKLSARVGVDFTL